MENHTECRIAWKSKITGFESHGNWLPKENLWDIDEIITDLNKSLPEINHWAEYR